MKKILFPFLFLVFASSAWAGSVYPGNANKEALPSFVDLAKKVQPVVVNISTTRIIKTPVNPFPNFGFRGDPFFEEFNKFFGQGREMEQPQHSLGSGFIIDEKGHILTNNHVVAQADEVLVIFNDGRQFKAEIVGTDPASDLAVIKIKAPKDMPSVELGDSDKVEPGEWVMAIGNPFGYAHTVTVGVVSAKGRVMPKDPNNPEIVEFIQTDASINPGNSGGPLFNTRGEVVGINTMILATGQGIGFAIPVNLAKEIVPQLIEEGSVTRGWLGVQLQGITSDLAESFNLKSEKGALVSDVLPNTPAEEGGLKRGDIILEFNGKEVEKPSDLVTSVIRTPAGKKVEMTVLRNGKKETLSLKVGKREGEETQVSPKEESQKEIKNILGVSVRNLRLDELREYDLSQDGGVIVQFVESGSNAERSDIRSGDVLLEINGDKVSNMENFDNIVSRLKSGQMVRLLLRRGTATIFVAFRL